MRVAKKHDVRLNEILDAAETLFAEKGYENATVNDILDKVGIGKGTFYHYFKSKEEVMDGVIRRTVEYAHERAKAVADDSSLSAHGKMRRAILSVNVSESPHGKVIDELHKPSNAQMHQKSITQTIQTVAPVLAGIVEQGIREGIYKTPYPLETIEFLLAASQFIFDGSMFFIFSTVSGFTPYSRLNAASLASCACFSFPIPIVYHIRSFRTSLLFFSKKY